MNTKELAKELFGEQQSFTEDESNAYWEMLIRNSTLNSGGRDPERIKVFCDRLAELWETNCPDWRFTQLVENVFMFGKNPAAFYLEDSRALQLLEEFFKE